VEKKTIQKYTFAATCARGAESLVVKEIESFGVSDVSEGAGVVNWQGDLESGYRACLFSRFSSRILLEVASFTVFDEESLYTGAASINWSDHFDEDSTFAIDCTVGRDALQIHSGFAALKTKDAIVDQFRNRSGVRPSVNTERPDVRVNLLIMKEMALVAIDLSGESLHRRGYRVSGSKAPLKESLAATICSLAGLSTQTAQLPAVIDPMCGSGTLLIEAALIIGDSAPGLSRKYFGFMGWKQHDARSWNRVVEEALEREDQGNRRDWPVLIGYDSDPESVKAARKNVSKAGLDNRIRIEKAECAALRAPFEKGLILSNLPFGERLMEKEEVGRLYSGLGRILRDRFNGWKVGVFISNPELTDSFGLQWQDRFRLFNGPLQCRLLTTTVISNPVPEFTWNIADITGLDQGVEFANRLKKNLKRTLKWARKNGVYCFRVYDRDLPDYNVSIDLYEKFVHVQEYAPPASIEEKTAVKRFRLVLKIVREILSVRSDRVFIKTRARQRGKKQYQKSSGSGKMFEVREGMCRYLVNFTDYLDTGLFIDHRPVRLRLFREAKDKRFLNLFGYTGTATVQAAAGGALSTMTVDLSDRYLHWARMNLFLNGYDTITNKVERADSLQWLKDCHDKFDLVFVDPPTFSNTKKEKRVFDIQRDHSRLLFLAMQRTEKDGLLIFSTNFRRFKPDETLFKKFMVKEITDSTIPFDYVRNSKIHRCWEFRHRVDGQL
jgi:23S rRNA (guanine2445-N2)-methyltransferase / 23S rRNA (guanine2069-N7)-methyltransferase